MPRAGLTRLLLLAALPVCAGAGCQQANALLAQNQLQTAQQQQTALNTQNQELLTKLNSLDRSNQELEALLAQSRQQNQIYTEQMAAIREQLGGAAQQLAETRQQQQDAEQRAQTLAASTRKRTGAAISANSSLQETLPVLNVAGVQTRYDGDVVRIELSCDTIFEPGTARLTPAASTTIDLVAAEVLRLYPKQLIGVEGYTDSDPPANGQWVNNHQLSVGRSMAVYDYLVSRTQLRPDQLFIVGHGANHPIVSNASPAGKTRNRRVELVIYPERLAAR